MPSSAEPGAHRLFVNSVYQFRNAFQFLSVYTVDLLVKLHSIKENTVLRRRRYKAEKNLKENFKGSVVKTLNRPFSSCS